MIILEYKMLTVYHWRILQFGFKTKLKSVQRLSVSIKL
jgi:hypothetical protein